jgi:AraC-like DNA-binding protein
MIRIFEGRFGRLALAELSARQAMQAGADPTVVLPQADNEVLLLNPGDIQVQYCETRALVFNGSAEWLGSILPAVFGSRNKQPFSQAREPITPRIRRLADALAVEILNDKFLCTERLEFMVQELVLSIVETYIAERRLSTRLWRGSPFADSRIRRALSLLRARPNKDLSMDELASQVGLSRSRFYDLFQVCTGVSPRVYLDMLCVETAIARLSSGQGKIAELAAELGFSAQSNFTRFFLHQVGVPPSEYRRTTTSLDAKDGNQGGAVHAGG